MKNEQNRNLPTLTQAEIACVGGSGGALHKPLRAQDMYGNTMSIEDYMDLQLDVMNGRTQSTTHDFYELHFNPGRPNIWTD